MLHLIFLVYLLAYLFILFFYAAKNFDILATNLSVLQKYFDSSTKLIF